MPPAQTPVKPRILVAPLDWGLGHATRCIPVIRYLITRGADVWLAGDGKIATLLKLEFPDLPFLPLPGYAVQYGKTPAGTLLALMRQAPRLLRIIKEEHAWLQAVVAAHNFNAVLSDNRYGLHHPAVYSVFMTHQLLVKTGTRATDALLQQALYRSINQFDACWIPDAEGAVTLAGTLSHPQKKPEIPVTYIGLLSRFSLADPVLGHYVLVLLSGQEPQRTLLEEKILQQAQLFQIPMLVVRGLPGTIGLPKVPYHVTIVNHLPAVTLQKAIAAAQYVISRCGYSTVMDLVVLHKKCIFIPTPMQTEQGYLAQHLMQQNAALCIPQQKFQLKNALELAAAFPYRLPELEKTDALEQAVDALLAALEQKKKSRLT